MRRLAKAQLLTGGEISPSVSFADSSLVRGSHGCGGKRGKDNPSGSSSHLPLHKGGFGAEGNCPVLLVDKWGEFSTGFCTFFINHQVGKKWEDFS